VLAETALPGKIEVDHVVCAFCGCVCDDLNATIDCCTSVCHGPSSMALQNVGEPTCTLGEVKNRADLLIYWGSNPAESHPRHFTRYTTTPKGLFTPKGRKGRTVVLVDVRPTPTGRVADIFLQIRPGKDFECLWALRALIRGKKVREEAIAETGLTLAQLHDLANMLTPNLRLSRCAGTAM
jgi:formylmethanofuran dehydrogenase subunit B